MSTEESGTERDMSDTRSDPWKAYRSGFMDGSSADTEHLSYEELSAHADAAARQYVDLLAHDDGAPSFEHRPIAAIVAGAGYPGIAKKVAAVEAENADLRGSPYADIRAERARQDNEWGADHDDMHIAHDWRQFRLKFERRIADHSPTSELGTPRENLVKLAALAVAQIQSLDRVSDTGTRDA